MIGLGMRITDVAEFNRRAAIALRGVRFLPGGWDKRFAVDMCQQLHRGAIPSEKQQRRLTELVHRYRRQISDDLVREFAAEQAGG